MIQESVICRFLMTLWAALADAWACSGVKKLLDRFGAWVGRGIGGSALFGLFWRDGAVTRSWPESLTCRVLTFLVNLPCAILRWLYQLGKGIWDGSFFCRALAALGGVPFLLLGGLAAVMLIAPHGIWDNRYALLGAVAVTAFFYLGSASRPAQSLEVRPLGPHFILFIGMACWAFLTSLDWGASLRFVGFYLTIFLLALLAVSGVKRVEQLQLMVALAVAGITVAALYGCYQGIIGVEVVANQQDLSLNAGMPGRIYSFFDNPNNFAELLVMLTPMTMALFLNAESWRGKLAALFSLGVCVIALGFTYSRSGWIGVALAVVVFIVFTNWRFLPLLVVLALCCVPVLPESIYNRILTIGNTKDSSTNYRFAIYEASAVLMKDYWFKGVGLGSDVLKATFKNYPTMFDGNYPIHTHNNYLQVWAEMGIGGLLAFLAMLVYQFKAGVKAFRAAADKRLKRLLAAAVSGFCGILLVSVAEYTWFYPRNMFLYFFLFGIITAGVKLARQSGKN